jgi:type I restriction enzyme S subunit
MPAFVDMCRLASEGTTNRVRIKEDRLMASQIPLPPIEEQQRIVAKVDAIAAKVAEASSLRATSESDLRQLLLAAYRSVSRNATSRRLAEVAPLVRRPVPLDRSLSYLELGVRSFGRGTFHKPPLSGSEIGTKKLFRIEPGDLVFNIVFAWEGAVAVARPEDRGRFGSHRFLTCVPRSGIASASYLCFHFLTDDGLAALGAASPGGAGRNRTLGLQALANLSVPLPDYQQQLWFDDLLSKATAIRTAAHESNTRLAAILPSVVDRAFRGEL